jgi:hypothetical protein
LAGSQTEFDGKTIVYRPSPIENLPPSSLTVNVVVRKVPHADDGLKSSDGTPPGDNVRVDASRGLVVESEQPTTAATATLATRV